MLAADITEYGTIYHNIGVAYACLGDFNKAGSYFSQAFEKGKNKESIREYIYCLLLLEDNNNYELVCRQFGITEEERDAIKMILKRQTSLAVFQKKLQGYHVLGIY